MEQAQHILEVRTQGQGLYEITDQVADWLAQQAINTGLLTIFCRHTSASLTIQENADPDVCRDLNTFFCNLVQEDPSLYSHTSEGPDDMPAHIKSALTDVSLNVPIVQGQLGLGTWQGIYVFEHRHHPHQRQIILHLIAA